MSPAASNPRPASPPGLRPDRAGFTLVEAVMALVVAGLLATATYRFFKDAFRSYNLQEQLTERDQNAHFALNRMVEAMHQAGSALPETGWTAIRRSGGHLVVGSNPRAAEHFQGATLPSSAFVPVRDARPFQDLDNALLKSTHVLLDFADSTRAISRVPIDVAYNQNGFVAGIKDNARGQDSLRLTTAVALAVGDRIYGYREDFYQVSSGSLLLRPGSSTANPMVLAENIDSLGITFKDRWERSTSAWRDMQSVSITVRARTARPDPKLPAPGYRKTTVSMNVNLRNRL